MLRKYTQRIEEGLILSVAEMGEKNRLRDSCEYSLMGGGKRIRPLLVLLIGEALEKGGDVLPSALSVEFFHTASLIADDLPCMDNDDFRRNRSSLHKEFGESVAILSSYTLIAAGYEGIYKNAVLMKKNKGLAERADAAVLFSLETAARCAGIQGATNGQFLDLFPPDQSGETIQKIIYQKTVTLFEIAFIFGWLFGGGDVSALEKLKVCAYHLGMAFQIGDDLQDSPDKISQSNSTNSWGREMAVSLFKRETALFKESLKELNLWTPSFQEFYRFVFQTDAVSKEGPF